MDKNTSKMLKLDSILAMIEPAGDCGRNYRHRLPVYKPGQESLVNRDYAMLSTLLAAIRDDNLPVEKLQNLLAHLAWLPQIIKAMGNRALLLHELFEIKQFIHYTLQLNDLLHTHHLEKAYPLPNLKVIYQILDPEGLQTPSFHLSPLYDKSLARYLNSMQQLQMQRRNLQKALAVEAQIALNLTSPKTEIVISRLQSERVKQLDASHFYRLAEENYVNLTYKLQETPALKRLNQRLAALSAKLQAAEYNVMLKLCTRLSPYAARLATAQNTVSRLDWDFAKARFAIRYECVIPSVTKAIAVDIRQAVNLPVKLAQTANGNDYQLLDLHFSTKVNVLTGPNMGGKTTALKTLGQLCALTSQAIPVPAQTARLCLFDTIWYNQDESETESLSSFGREVVALSAVLRKKGRLLLLMDELAKGTNPQEGEAILTAVLQYLKQLPCICLAATHYDKPNTIAGIRRFAIRGINEKQLLDWDQSPEIELNDRLRVINQLMDYGLIPVNKYAQIPHNALSIASILGLPPEIINTAGSLIK